MGNKKPSLSVALLFSEPPARALYGFRKSLLLIKVELLAEHIMCLQQLRVDYPELYHCLKCLCELQNFIQKAMPCVFQPQLGHLPPEESLSALPYCCYRRLASPRPAT
jgi:hypothetical protein